MDAAPTVQWALNTAYRKRYASTPYHVMFGRTPSTGEDWKVDALDEEALRRKAANVIRTPQRVHKVVEERAKKNLERQRQASIIAEGSYPTLRWEPM